MTRNEDDVEENSTPTSNNVAMANGVSVIDDTENGDDGFEDGVLFSVFKQKESWRDVCVNNELQKTDRTKMLDMLETYSDVLE